MNFHKFLYGEQFADMKNKYKIKFQSVLISQFRKYIEIQ